MSAPRMSRSRTNHWKVSRSTSGTTAYAMAASASASGTTKRSESGNRSPIAQKIPFAPAANFTPRAIPRISRCPKGLSRFYYSGGLILAGPEVEDLQLAHRLLDRLDHVHVDGRRRG